jgi:hypothetical protein
LTVGLACNAPSTMTEAIVARASSAMLDKTESRLLEVLETLNEDCGR